MSTGLGRGHDECRQPGLSRGDLRPKLRLIFGQRVTAAVFPSRPCLPEEPVERVGLEGLRDLVELGQALPDLGYLADRPDEA